MISTFTRIKQTFPKRQFNVTSKDDLKVYKHFLEKGSWGSIPCPFELEWPWLSVPDMISHKIAVHTVEKL